MTQILHQEVPSSAIRHWSDRVLVPEMWGTVAIGAMWLAVLFDGIYGGDFAAQSTDGSATRIPSVVFVAFFALLATIAVARRAFARWPSD